jgi:2-polyprenyl-3-methyl-5-hydroxy-6-metoxy-1,4-benzoquinol methylase
MEIDTNSINRAFSKQSVNYDAEDGKNLILQDMRNQVYDHVSKYLKPNSKILELNAGTGIDALHFVQEGHIVHATDVSDGMIHAIENKINRHHHQAKFTCQQLSFVNLEKLAGRKFDYIFSNFGGLNCIDDLSKVGRHLPGLLNNGAFVTWVIMPPVSAWELLWVLKGRPKAAFRRINKSGILAHLEGEYVRTFYHSLSDVSNALGPAFHQISAEGLCALSPPPSRADFPIRHKALYKNLRKIDSMVRHKFPFNRWGDHLIVTFRYLTPDPSP